jgi:hypothetical protein
MVKLHMMTLAYVKLIIQAAHPPYSFGRNMWKLREKLSLIKRHEVRIEAMTDIKVLEDGKLLPNVTSYHTLIFMAMAPTRLLPKQK